MENKYIKKQVEIEAVQWNGNNIEEIMKFIKSPFKHKEGQVYATEKFSYDGFNLKINTLEGVLRARIGDYIIKGVNGEFYPCKPDIFEKTYDKTPTEEEIKKEWEELGYKVENNYRNMKICFDGEVAFILNTRVKDYSIYLNSISFQEHQLLTKTFKMLGWE